MRNTEQTEGQSVYEHGQDVWRNFEIIYNCLMHNEKSDEVKIPDWMYENWHKIYTRLYELDTIETYLTFHDAGKAYCLEYDEEGRKHFRNHAEVSYKKWLEVSNDRIVANLILHDMDIHTLKSEDIPKFASISESATLLLAGLAEINSNAKMFGGFDSTSFKIKYKQIDKKGKRILQNWS
jgi:hypothetical protein